MEVCRRWLYQPLSVRRHVVWLAVLGIGCHSQPGMELMERDLRLQEDHIYQLQDHLAEQQAMLDSCRRENAALRAELSGQVPRERIPLRSDERREVEPRPVPPLITPPDVELGQPVGPEEIPNQGSPLDELGQRSAPLPGEGDVVLSGGGQPLRLTINRWLTGGLDTNGEPGDEGLMVVLEPRDEAGSPVRLQGAVTLAVFEEGGRDRVARWDFSADEVAASWKKSLFGHGYHFELAWPAGPPLRPGLQLQAQLLSAQGPTLQASHRFAVELPVSYQALRSEPDRRIPWRPDR